MIETQILAVHRVSTIDIERFLIKMKKKGNRIQDTYQLVETQTLAVHRVTPEITTREYNRQLLVQLRETSSNRNAAKYDDILHTPMTHIT